MALSLSVVRAYLIADTATDLYAEVGTRIDTLGQQDNTRPFIVMVRRGGGDTDRLPANFANPFVQFKVYGGTGKVTEDPSGPLRSSQVYEKLKERLHLKFMQTTSEGMLMSAFEQQAPQDLVDPDNSWPFVLAFYETMTRDTS